MAKKVTPTEETPTVSVEDTEVTSVDEEEEVPVDVTPTPKVEVDAQGRPLKTPEGGDIIYLS